MRMTLEIAAPGKQGAPAHGLPYQTAPKSVVPLRGGGVLLKDQMAQVVSLIGAEQYQSRYAAKWNESAPLAALSNGHTFGGTGAPQDTLSRIMTSAYELDHEDVVNGAVRLRNLISWLAFCTLPWTTLGQPPLLRLRFGVFDGYVYLTEFDPQVTDWMLDDPKGKATGLPYEATFTLQFKREPLGLAALEPKRGLPKTTQAGGALPSLNGGVPGGAGNPASLVTGPIKAVVSGGGASKLGQAAAGAVKAFLPFGGR